MSLKSLTETLGFGTLLSMSSWYFKFKEGVNMVMNWMWTAYYWPWDGIAGAQNMNKMLLPYRYLDPEHKTIDCKYTCHYKCVNDVGLDCAESPAFREDSPDPSPQHTLVSIQDGDDELDTLFTLSRDELRPKIDLFNSAQRRESITLNEEGATFSGQVTIHINLSRPVSVRTGCPLPDVCSTLRQYDHSIDTNKRRTTFFLPKATIQDMDITCYTTAQDVIRNLLAKLQLIDNPRKFALFERTEENGEVFMRKLVDEDKPLFMCLGWIQAIGAKKFELRENETGVIEWEAFTIPELQNFLRILDKEEEEYIQQVRKKYIKYQTMLQEAVENIDGRATPTEQIRA